MNLFVYGELCKSEVLRREIGRVPDAAVAVLSGFRRRRAESGFFVVEPHAGATVSGLLLAEVTAEELARLDRFEGVNKGVYRRAQVVVRTLSASPDEVAAHVYAAAER